MTEERDSEASTAMSVLVWHFCHGVIGGDSVQVLTAFIPGCLEARLGNGVRTDQRVLLIGRRRSLYIRSYSPYFEVYRRKLKDHGARKEKLVEEFFFFLSFHLTRLFCSPHTVFPCLDLSNNVLYSVKQGRLSFEKRGTEGQLLTGASTGASGFFIL